MLTASEMLGQRRQQRVKTPKSTLQGLWIPMVETAIVKGDGGWLSIKRGLRVLARH